MSITRERWKEKQLYGCFKRLMSNISREKKGTWLRKGNHRRKTESLLISVQNKAIRTSHIKARKDKMQQNSKYRLCGERDKTINHIKSECSKLVLKYIRLNATGSARWSTANCVRNLNLIIRIKWCLYNPPTVLENGTHKFHWDFITKMDHLISARRPHLTVVDKKKKKKKKKKERTCKIVDFAVPADYRIKLKKVKRRIGTWTLLDNWKNYGTWKWCLYRLQLVLLVLSPKDY